MNAISDLWNGRFGLAKTYWLWGVLSGIPWGLVLSLVTPGSTLAILGLLALVAYYVIVNVGIWRAASQYQGIKAWAILAKVAVAITPASLVIGTLAAIIIPAVHQPFRQVQQPMPAAHPETSLMSGYKKPPTLASEGWTQENTGSTESGPWLDYDPPGTRYSRMADGSIYRFFPPGVRPDAEKANPFGLDTSIDRPPR